MQITSRHMESSVTMADQWFVESGRRGEGAFLGRITPAGGRLFYFRYADPKRMQVRLPIGSYAKNGAGGGVTVAAARAIALEWAVLYKSGVIDLRQHFAETATEKLRADDAAQRRTVADAQAAEIEQQRRLTVRQLFERWAAAELAPHIRGDGKRVGRKDAGQYTRDQFERRLFPALGDVAAIDVRKADVLAILDAAKIEGKMRTANMLLADVKQMFSFAAEREIIEHSPVEKISKRKIGGADVERDRVLSMEEITALAKALPMSSMQKRSALAIWMILATGCRTGELMAAEWSAVNTTARTWHLTDTKNQRDHTIHLSDFALVQIAKLKELREAGPDGEPVSWLFPNTAGKAPVDIKSFGKQLADRQRDPNKRLQNRAKDTTSLTLAGGRWTAHDLRRSAATLMARIGVSTDVIDECLNHKLQNKVARVYIRDRREADQAKAFDALGLLLHQLFTTGSNQG